MREWDFDLYQRYAALARVLECSLGPEGGEPWTVLDVGSGADFYTARALGPAYRVLRADVDPGQDPEVVRLERGQPLPFPDRSFDAVVSMDVLEHLPAVERSRFLTESLRVAKRVLVVAFPNAVAAVEEAEARYAALHQQLRGPHRFLAEHASFGLPDPSLVRAQLEAAGAHVLELENNPLVLWEAFSTLDLLAYEDKTAFPLTIPLHQEQNTRYEATWPGQVHYRRIVVASRDQAALTRVRSPLPSPPPLTSASSFFALANMGVHLLKLWQGARQQSDALVESVAERERVVQQLERRASELESALREVTERMRASLEAKDAQIAGMTERLDDQAAALTWRDAEIRAVQEARAQMTVTLESRDAQIASLGKRIAELESAWSSVQRSRSWKLTAPLRAMAGKAAAGRRALGVIDLRRGRDERRRAMRLLAASPAFDPGFYLELNPDVAQAGQDPVHHYLTFGAYEGRDPHPLFDSSFYLEQNPDVAQAGRNPLVHYLTFGAAEGRDPHPLFDSSFYLEGNADVAQAGVNPLAHYLASGAAEGRDPHPLFDSSFYSEENPGIGHLNPLVHFLRWGGQEGRDPSPSFDSSFYLDDNPDVANRGVNPLLHFVLFGHREGRAPHPSRVPRRGSRLGYRPPPGLLPSFTPLNLELREELALSPHLDVLLPSLAQRHLSGGPNTAISLAYHLAAAGVAVRFLSTDAAPDSDPSLFPGHVRALTGIDTDGLEVQVVDASDRRRPTAIGENDVFLATAWWTAQMAKYALEQCRASRFLYLIQDFEALFHPASSAQALALETYGLDHVPIVNTGVLRDHLARNGLGRFGDEAFARDAIVFEPAIDRRYFYPEEPRRRGSLRRLLFYARPNSGVRNLFEIGVASLQKAIHDGVLDPKLWRFVGIGDAFAPIPLGGGAVLEPSPWLGFEDYARLMRQSDLLLSPMLSPHPSYPPLEMAACGRTVVTTSFGAKTAERLRAISANIVAADPTIEGIAEGLDAAMHRLSLPASGEIGLPASWEDAFLPVLPRILEAFAEVALSRRALPGDRPR